MVAIRDVREQDEPGRDDVTARLRARDALAWEHCYDQWFPRMYAYAYRRTADRQAASDIASDVFVHALRDIGRYEDRGLPFEAWLYRLAHDRTVDHLRRRRRHTTVRLEAAANHGVDDGAEERAGQQAMLDAIQRLSEDQQAVVLLRFYEGLSGETVAEILGKSPGAVRALQFRALRQLRGVLSEAGDELGVERDRQHVRG